MKRAYFCYYETFETAAGKFKDAATREHFRGALINYGLYGIEPADLSDAESPAFEVCKDLIDQQRNRCEQNAANARKKEESTPRFVPPTAEEINAFCKEKNISINTDAFINYYESNGWKIGGKTKMKSWTAAVQNWYARDKKAGSGTVWQKEDNAAEDYSEMFK